MPSDDVTLEQTQVMVAVPLLDKAAKLVARAASAIGASILVLMMFLTAADVFLRYVLNRPILGGVELTEFMMAIIVAVGLATNALRKGHITVEFLTEKLSPRAQAIINSTTCFISLGVFIVITWWTVVYAENLRAGQNASGVLFIPIYPFVYMVALGSAVICLVLLANLVQYLTQVIRGNRSWAWIGLFALIALVLALFAGPFWGRTLWQINPLTVGLLGTLVLIAVLFSGMAVGICMALIGFLGMAYVSNIGAGLAIMGTTPYATAASYTNSVIPLFVLMGAFCFYSGLSRELYYAAYRWIGRLPGGLAMATIAACAGFAATTGSSMAEAATMGQIAIPEMRRHNYSPAFAAGTVAAGGTLGILIPPSVGFIVYGIIAEQSIGKLFIAGIFPGLLLSFLFMVQIYIRCKLNPRLGGGVEAFTWAERLRSITGIWGMLFILLLVIGGIYGGIFTPTEAGAVGAFGTFCIALLRRQLNWSNFSGALFEMGRVTAMVFLILIGAMIFNAFLTVSRLPMMLSDLIIAFQVPPYATLAIILLIYIPLGMLMESLSMLVLTIPIFVPILVALGFDPIWTGVLIVVMMEMGLLTPPVGLNCYVIAGIARDVPLGTIFRGITPFVITQAICVVLLVAFPQISMFLVNLM